MKKKFIGILLCSAVLLAGCANSKAATSSTTTSVSEASSVPTAAESEASSTPKTYADVPTADDTTSTAENFDEFLTLADYKNAKLSAPEGAAAESGNTVNIDYSGSIDGVAFDGGTAQGHDLVLGSGTFIPGFEDQLIGHKAGESFDIVVTFPENYGNDSLNGKEATFAIKINSIALQTVDQAFQQIVSASEVKTYPKDVIDKWTKDFTSMYQAAADQAGQSVEEYMASIGYTSDMLESNVKNYSQSELVARAILKQEGITKDSEEYKTAESELPSLIGFQLDQAKQLGYTDSQLEYLTIYRAALDLIQKYAA